MVQACKGVGPHGATEHIVVPGASHLGALSSAPMLHALGAALGVDLPHTAALSNGHRPFSQGGVERDSLRLPLQRHNALMPVSA